MAWVTFAHPVPWPGPISNFGAFNALLLDAAGGKVAFICTAPKTGTISKVGFRTGTVTTAQSLDVRLETVDVTTGDPTGTLEIGLMRKGDCKHPLK